VRIVAVDAFISVRPVREHMFAYAADG
jgi:hypothetical protein